MDDRVEITGAIAILTNRDGVILATGTDFDGLRPGYSTIDEAQSAGARQDMRDRFIRQWCGADIAACMAMYHADELIRKLCQFKGYRVSTETVQMGITLLKGEKIGDQTS